MLDLLTEAQSLEGDIPEQYEDWLSQGQAATDRIANRVACVVLLAASWIEAVLNETYIHCVDRSFPTEHPLREHPQACEALAALWTEWHPSDRPAQDPGWSKRSTAALKALGVQHPRNALPSFHDTELLFEMRNALTHAKPESLTHGALSSADIAKRLGRLQQRLEKRFPTAKGVPTSAIFMWVRVLGRGCAEWAASTAQSFVEEWRLELAKAGAIYHSDTEPVDGR